MSGEPCGCHYEQRTDGGGNTIPGDNLVQCDEHESQDEAWEALAQSMTLEEFARSYNERPREIVRPYLFADPFDGNESLREDFRKRLRRMG